MHCLSRWLISASRAVTGRHNNRISAIVKTGFDPVIEGQMVEFEEQQLTENLEQVCGVDESTPLPDLKLVAEVDRD